MKKKFEDLLVWKSARKLVSKIYTKTIKPIGHPPLADSLAKTKQLRVIARSLPTGTTKQSPKIKQIASPLTCQRRAQNDTFILLYEPLNI